MRRLTTLHLPFALLRPAYNHGMRIIRLFLTILILVAAFSVVYAVVDELGVLAPESIPAPPGELSRAVAGPCLPARGLCLMQVDYGANR